MDVRLTLPDNVNMASVKKEKHVLQRTYLKEWREFRGFNQEQASELIDVSRTLLSKLENSKTPYTQRTLELAAKMYDCSVPALLASDPTNPNDAWRVYEMALSLDERGLKTLLDLTSSLIESKR